MSPIVPPTSEITDEGMLITIYNSSRVLAGSSTGVKHTSLASKAHIEFSQAFGPKKKVVFSRSLASAEDGNMRIVHTDLRIAGEGRRLMEGMSLPEKLPLKLVESKTFKSGCVALRYLKQWQKSPRLASSPRVRRLGILMRSPMAPTAQSCCHLDLLARRSSRTRDTLQSFRSPRLCS